MHGYCTARGIPASLVRMTARKLCRLALVTDAESRSPFPLAPKGVPDETFLLK